MVRLVLPVYALVLAPIHVAHLYASLQPAWREWYAANDTWLMACALLAEFTIMGLYSDGVVWHVTGQYDTPRIMVWPSIAVVSSSLCDVLAHSYVPIQPLAYAALMALKWATLNLPVFFLAPSEYDAWAALFSTAVSLWLCVSTPMHQKMAAQQQLQ
jgi:hypothetical protein